MGLLVFQVLLLWLSSMPVLSGALVARWERQYLPVAVQEAPIADAIVVLGGAVEGALPPRLEEDLGDGADRVLHAVRLFKAGKADTIIACGGNLPWLGDQVAEASVIQSLLVEWGVPAGDILAAGSSRNTHENALEIRNLMRAREMHSALLVTSALHMPRALAVFRAAGIEVTPAPTDYVIVDRDSRSMLDFLPDAEALALTTALAREWLGMAYYRLRGWIQ